MRAEKIHINGIVQGVGFRPFIYNLATKNNLKGWVLNCSEGVLIHVEGEATSINIFKKEIIKLAPPLSKINSFSFEETKPMDFSDFTIKESITSQTPEIFISPDIGTCSDCEKDIFNKENPRYFYPFTNCTSCGPRFSIIQDTPYDRKNTTMKDFPMCENCYEEYTSVSNRRFHAQPNCCYNCGPHIFITNNLGEDLSKKISKNLNYNSPKYTKALLKFFSSEILKGKIFAIKSLSGFHLSCNALDEKAIATLRERKKRPKKPFALMMKSIETIKEYCIVSPEEESLLKSNKRPIVLLRKKTKGKTFPNNIAPNNNRIGIMLPSTPLHLLIFKDKNIQALVMTSGNLSSLPLEFKNESALKNLSSFADYFLLHNRDIEIPVDDSICSVVNNNLSVIRSARGFAPASFYLPNYSDVLALGGNMKNTFSISKGDYIFTSPHGGDLINYEAVNRYKLNINHFLKIFQFTPKYIACDLHPNYESTILSKNFNLPITKVQHHHAHIVSCMIDNNYKDKVIGVAFDGTGMGDDNSIWGSEFFICDYKDYKRVGHLEYTNFLGGDNSLLENYKTALSYISNIYSTFPEKELLDNYLDKIYDFNWKSIISIINSKFNTYNSSSMGRLFDGVSSLLNLCHKSTFEGEGAISLESLINLDSPSIYYGIILQKTNGMYLFSVNNLITNILKDILKDTPAHIISYKFHNTIVKFIYLMCTNLRKEYNINVVALSGGVFQNSYLLNKTIEILEEANFKVLIHKNIPTNDGGISIGQLVIAKNNINSIM